MQAMTDWVGRTESARDEWALTPVRCMHALLDRPGPAPALGDPLPWGWHWLWFFNQHPAPQAQLDQDGHPRRGDFLPPVPMPRRMWAGSRVQFHGEPLRVGEAFQRHSRIQAVLPKQGRSGTAVFVTVAHEIHGPRGLAIAELQDIVYRAAAAPGTPLAVPPRAELSAQWRMSIEPAASWLFRYSALTFNAHRIHYDRPYACEVEGYPGLVVHGPLQATLLLELLARHHPGRELASFDFRARSPLFDLAPFEVCGAASNHQQVELWTQDAHGGLATQAVAVWR